MKTLAISVLTLSILASNAFAQWQVDGTMISSTDDQNNSDASLISDGSSGIIVAWLHFDPVDSMDVYVQRLDASGFPLWGSGGVRVCGAPHNQYSPNLASDGSGGVIVAWFDQRNGGNYYFGDIYAQRVNAAGVAQWTTDGVPISTAANVQRAQRTLADGLGGAVIVWEDDRSGDFDIYAQRVNSTGVVLWPANGQAICTALGAQMNPALSSDGPSATTIAWSDFRSGAGNDVYAQRIDGAGGSLWTANGVAVCTAFSFQIFPKIVSDGAVGALIAWIDNRDLNQDVYAQRLNSAGVAQWAANGVPVCVDPALQQLSRVSPTSAGGIDLVWLDRRNGTDGDIYVQRLSSAGAPLWTLNGRAVATGPFSQASGRIVSTPSGTFVTWSDSRAGNYDIYAQKLDATGTPQWTANGVAVCAATGDQSQSEVVPDGNGGVILDWLDARSGSNALFAERITGTGESLHQVVTHTDDDNSPGSLRAAMQQANATPGAQKIGFNIPGPGPHAIVLTSSLPAITDELIIDGYTQPGASPNTNPVESPCNAQIMIDIHGGTTGDGFKFQAPGTLRGLATHSFYGREVVVEASPVVIEGNFIGIDPSGNGGWMNKVGIWIQADNCRVGGSSPAARNVISEGPFSTVGIKVEGVSGTTIIGNYIGTDQNLVNNGVGNSNGILIEGFSMVTIVGSTDPSMNPQEANVIAYNGIGITLLDTFAIFSHLYGNSIRYNYSMSIDLDGDGRTPNDAGDSDNGPNQLQNFPDIATASGTQITGTMHGQPNSNLRIDFYRSGYSPYAPDADRYLGRVNVGTDGSGNAPFTFVPAQPLPPAYITATAHDNYGNTSEVSDYKYITNTPAGSNVVVSLVDDYGALRGTATFSQVSSASNTFVTNPYSPPAPVSGMFSVGNPNDPSRYFDVSTLAVYGGGVDICLFYDENNIPGPETSLVLVHYNGSAWEDVTTSRDTVNNKVCGYVSTLSPFAIAVPVPTGVHDQPIPNRFALHANAPNPFNPVTTIGYDVPAGGAEVNITVYDVAGRRVRELVNERRAAGMWSVTWSGDDDRGQRVATGVYFYRMRAGGFTETRKMVLLK